jgi:hypothetical protein
MAERIEIIGTSTALDQIKFFQEFFLKTYTNEGSFCSFPTEPFMVDTFSHSDVPLHFGKDEARFPRMCEVVRKSFGLWPAANGPSFYSELRAFDKPSLLALVNTLCFPAPGIIPSDPYSTSMGRECIRAMQSAYCSTGCTEYGKAQGRLCPNRYRDYLYRVCAPWTAGMLAYNPVSGPLKNGCPLDPNNLPWDGTHDAFCDEDVFHLQGSSFFEDFFGLND